MTPKSPLSSILLALTALIAAGCSPAGSAKSSAPEAEPAEIDYLAISSELANELQSALGPKLMAAMQSSGPAGAIVVCQEVAQDLTEATQRIDPKVTIRRTALRVRNPANAPDALDRGVMEAWITDNNRVGPPEPVLSPTENGTIVHRPIMTAELCLQCHGSANQIAPETAKLIAQLYPEDAATGFNAGELRGAFRIEFRDSAN